MIQTMNNYAMSGPTTSKNKYLPIFNWNSVRENISHRGVPEKFDFHWLNLNPENIKDDKLNDK